MKSIIRLALIAIVAMASTGVAFAQDKDKEKKERPSREQMAEMQAKHIANEMAFDDDTAERFIETFTNYQKEIWALGPQHGKKEKRDEAMSEKETEQAIKARFEHSQKLLDIRQKYYAAYSKFLTQKQIERVYQLEHKMMDDLSKHHKDKKGDRPKHRPDR